MKEIVEVIKDGGVVIMPTDTIYGIIADATNESAIQRVYEMKKRNENKPMLMLVNGKEMLEKYVSSINDVERKLIDELWPGALTIILKKKNVSDLLTGGLDTVGIRFPDNELLIDIMNELNVPLLSTSVNVSGAESATCINNISNSILDSIDYVYDVGECKGEPSTIVVVNNNELKVLREGIIKSNEIFDIIKN
ncbi:MAG: L-threonylcarbamoyladenylate synthase [Candidatus Coprovivens sp.]